MGNRNRKRPAHPVPESVKTKAKKDTHQWCRGVVGREHVWAWTSASEIPNRGLYVPRREGGLLHEWLTCRVCGKQQGREHRVRCPHCGEVVRGA